MGQTLKLDRTELIRMIEAMPKEGHRDYDVLGMVIGGLITAFGAVGVAQAIAQGPFGGSRGILTLQVFILVLGLAVGGISLWHYSQRRLFSKLQEEFSGDVRAGDLAEALHQTSNWRQGERLALELWKGGENSDFGAVWLAGQCGNKNWAKAYRVLNQMDGVEAVTKAIRRRTLDSERRKKSIGGTFCSTYTALNVVNMFFLKSASRGVLLAAGLLSIGVIVLSVGKTYWMLKRRGPEWEECYGFLSRLPDEDLEVLVGNGRLGRIAKAVWGDRRLRNERVA